LIITFKEEVMFFSKIKRIGFFAFFIMLMMLAFAAAAFAFAAPASTDPFYGAWNFVTNTVIGGALGTAVAICGMGYGVYQFIKHPELGLMATLGAGCGIACLGVLPTIVSGLGMVI
jgi:hypothetical protein